jgi:hypothetical protein
VSIGHLNENANDKTSGVRKARKDTRGTRGAARAVQQTTHNSGVEEHLRHAPELSDGGGDGGAALADHVAHGADAVADRLADRVVDRRAEQSKHKQQEIPSSVSDSAAGMGAGRRKAESTHAPAAADGIRDRRAALASERGRVSVSQERWSLRVRGRCSRPPGTRTAACCTRKRTAM